MSTAFLGEPGAQLLLSPNQGGLGDASQKRWVCVHGTGGFSSASDVANYFGSPSSQVSSTYIVGLDGEYYQCVSENESAWANGGVTGIPKIGGIGLPVYGDGVYRDPWWTQSLNPNRVTISIEHVKVSRDNSDSLTPPQQKTSMWLIYNVCKRWSIPMRPADALGGITGHYSMDAINRPRCPGPYSWDDLFAYCNQRQQEETMLTIQQAANYFTSSPDGVYWTAKSTGYVIGHAILQFYRQFGASAYCGLTYLGRNLGQVPIAA